MTDEEKAEEYIMREDVVTENDRVPVDNGYGWQTVSFEDEVKQAYLDGLAEGKKEKCFEQNKDGTIRPCEVMKENEELKEQIEKMKNNYKKQRNRRIDDLQKKNAELKAQLKLRTERVVELEKEVYSKNVQIKKMKCCGNCKNQHIDYERRISCRLSQYYKNCDKWELAE